MVLRGAQIHRRGQAKCSLVTTRSLPHDLVRLYRRALPFTSADLGDVAGPYLDEVQLWTDFHGQEIVLCDSIKTSRSSPAASRPPLADGPATRQAALRSRLSRRFRARPVFCWRRTSNG